MKNVLILVVLMVALVVSGCTNKDVETTPTIAPNYERDVNSYEPPPKTQEEESSETNSEQYDPAPSNSARHDETTSYIIAQDIVESYLKAPSTANFCRMSECSIQHLGNGEYMVVGWVEAQNSYGAMLRQEFIVTYTATEKGYTNGYCVM